MIAGRGYVPQPGTIAARAIAWFQEQGVGKSVPTAVLADALDVDPRGLTNCLGRALAAGALSRERSDGLWFWSLAIAHGADAAATPDDDPDFSEVKRTVPAASAPPLIAAGPAPSWIPPLEGIVIEHPASSRPASLAEPDDRPVAPRLGWREGRPAAPERADEGSAVQSERLEEPAAAPPPPDVATERSAVAFAGAGRQGSAPAGAVEPAAATGVPRPFRCAMWSDGTLQVERSGGELVHLDGEETRALLDYLDRVLRAEAA